MHLRKNHLEKMGYKSYQEYLRSDLWKSIRQKVLDRSNRTCECCGKAASQVHHWRYSPAVFRGEQLSYLIAVCDQCHRSCEFGRDGQKNSHTKANRWMYALLVRLNPVKAEEIKKLMGYRRDRTSAGQVARRDRRRAKKARKAQKAAEARFQKTQEQQFRLYRPTA